MILTIFFIHILRPLRKLCALCGKRIIPINQNLKKFKKFKIFRKFFPLLKNLPPLFKNLFPSKQMLYRLLLTAIPLHFNQIIPLQLSKKIITIKISAKEI